MSASEHSASLWTTYEIQSGAIQGLGFGLGFNFVGEQQQDCRFGPYALEPLLTLKGQPAGYADHIAFHQGAYTDPNQQIPYLGHQITQTLPQLNDADLIILLGHNFSDLQQFNRVERFEEHQLSKLKQAWEENAIAQSLDASKAGRVYFIPIYLCAGLPGPIGTELYLNELKEQLLSPIQSMVVEGQ